MLKSTLLKLYKVMAVPMLTTVTKIG